MNELETIAYLDAVDVFTSEVEYRWEDDVPVPTDDYIMDNDFDDNF